MNPNTLSLSLACKSSSNLELSLSSWYCRETGGCLDLLTKLIITMMTHNSGMAAANTITAVGVAITATTCGTLENPGNKEPAYSNYKVINCSLGV